MTFDEYCDFVTEMASEKSMVDFKAKLATGGLGLAGEGGETADIAKKVLFHGLEWDETTKNKLKKELGDIMWYVAFTARHVLGMSIEEIIEANVAKLNERYKGGKFSVEEFTVKESLKKE